jgi:purine-nucleoside phosphorylase
MPTYKQQVCEAAAFLREHLPLSATVGVLTGTGLGECADQLDVAARIDYHEIPHFPLSTVTTHHGRLLCGTLAGRPVIALQGRFHLYEGYAPLEVTFAVRVLQLLGLRTLILTNAAGGINRKLSTGAIMLIRDHINLTGANPLVGPNMDDWGPRFPDMSAAYDQNLAAIAVQAARRIGVELPSGTYAGLKGPSLETPAEVRFLQSIGADAVGFSTVHEVIAAVHAGMQVLGLSVITNLNDPEHPVPATVEDIIAVARSVNPTLARLIREIVEHSP